MRPTDRQGPGIRGGGHIESNFIRLIFVGKNVAQQDNFCFLFLNLE
jgi:hypothetical protein